MKQITLDIVTFGTYRAQLDGKFKSIVFCGRNPAQVFQIGYEAPAKGNCILQYADGRQDTLSQDTALSLLREEYGEICFKNNF